MKLKLKYKILLLFAIVSLCVLLVIGGLLSTRLKREELISIYNSLQGQLAHINFALTSTFIGVKQDLKGIVANPPVRSMDDAGFTNFTEADESSFQYRIGEPEQKIIDIFARFSDNHDYVNSVYVGRENGSFVRSHKRNRPTRYDPRKKLWYQLAKNNPGKIMHTAPYSSETTIEVNIGIVTALLDENGTVYGVVGLDVTLASLSNYIERIKVGRNGYLLLLDEEGTILAAPNKSMVFQSIEAICKDDLDHLFAKKQGVVTFNRDNQEHYLVFNDSPVLNWKIAFVIPSIEIDQEVRAFVTQVLIVLAISLFLLSVLTLIGLEHFVVKPLRKLNEGTEIIASTGDLDHQIQIPAGDEIGSLAASFNRMTRDLKAHIKKLTEATAARERIESELKIAREIQMDLLPDIFPPFPDRNEFEIYAVIEPAKQVGGDLYDFFFIDDHHLFFFIGDVSDKGVPAALFMARTKTLIQSAAKGIDSSDKVLHRVNKELSINNESFMFVTAFCGILNVKTGEVSYANAGHNPPLITRQGKEADFLTGSRGIALGIDGESIYQEADLNLLSGDTLFMYTDGVTEAFNIKKEQFSEERLQKEITVHQKDSIEVMVRSISEKVQLFSGEMPQSDDIAILALKYC